MKQYAFVIELDRCIGCKGCQVACKMENGTALGSDRIKVRTVGPTGIYPNLEMYFMPTMCQQCENPVCVRVCPSGAVYKSREDGIIRIETKKCIGCHSCAMACPYGIPSFGENGKMIKCDGCYVRVHHGMLPACVKACPVKALQLVDTEAKEPQIPPEHSLRMTSAGMLKQQV